MKKEQNRCINFFKGISCIAVILMHCNYPNKIYSFVPYALYFAVSFFFMISGYFLHGNSQDKVKKKIIHILKIAVIAEVVYGTYRFLFVNEKFMTINGLLQAITRIAIGSGGIFSGILWFVYALFLSYVCMYFIVKSKHKKVFFPLAFILLGLHTIAMPIVKSLWDGYDVMYFRNFILFGLPFVIIGYFIKEYQDKLSSFFTNKKCIILAILGEIILGLEYLISRQILDLYIGTILTSISLFLFAINNPKKYINKYVEQIGKNLYLYVYIMHIMIITIIENLSISLGLQNNVIYSYFAKYVIIILLTVMIAYMIYKIKEFIAERKKLKHSV